MVFGKLTEGRCMMMTKTMKGRLTISVICIVAVSILLTTLGIVMIAGQRIMSEQKEILQLYADKYGEEINTWIENEKMLADGTAGSIEAAENLETDFIQSVVDVHAAGTDGLSSPTERLKSRKAMILYSGDGTSRRMRQGKPL